MSSDSSILIQKKIISAGKKVSARSPGFGPEEKGAAKFLEVVDLFINSDWGSSPEWVGDVKRIAPLANGMRIVPEKWSRFMPSQLPVDAPELVDYVTRNWRHMRFYKEVRSHENTSDRIKWDQYMFLFEESTKIMAYADSVDYFDYFELLMFSLCLMGIRILLDPAEEPTNEHWHNAVAGALHYDFLIRLMYQFPLEIRDRWVALRSDERVPPTLKLKFKEIHDTLIENSNYERIVRELRTDKEFLGPQLDMEFWKGKDLVIPNKLLQYAPEMQKHVFAKETDPELYTELKPQNLLSTTIQTIHGDLDRPVALLAILAAYFKLDKCIEFADNYIAWDYREIEKCQFTGYPKLVNLSMNEWGLMSDTSIVIGGIYSLIWLLIEHIRREGAKFPKTPACSVFVPMTDLTEYETQDYGGSGSINLDRYNSIRREAPAPPRLLVTTEPVDVDGELGNAPPALDLSEYVLS
jgi:hypothetical protein